jgi:hypothetical protein
VNPSNPLTESPNPSQTGPHLVQVDPPHPFRSAFKTVAVAAILVTTALAIFVYFVRRPPVAAGEVTEVNYYPVHSTIGGGGPDGMQGSNETYDQLLILAKVRVRNQTNIPVFLQDISITVTMPDGSEQMNVAAGARDADRVFQAFPSLDSLRSAPFDRDATLSPGQSTEGLAIFSFPFTRQQWDSRKAANIVVSLIHQDNLTISFPR